VIAVHLYDIVLFLHICAAFTTIGLAGLLHGSEWLLRRATTVGEARMLARAGAATVLFPISGIALLGLGMSLIALSSKPEKYGFCDPFVWSGIIGLVILMVSGPVVMKPHHDQLTKAIVEAPDGPLPAELRRLILEPRAMVVGYADSFIVVSVIFTMVTKPNAVVVASSMAVALVLGGWLGSFVARPVAGANLAVTMGG